MTASLASWWYTAAEIAQMGLPCLPDTVRSVHAWAKAEGWADRRADDGTPLARKRQARGGGVEYHASLFPEAAQAIVKAKAVEDANARGAANDTGEGDADAWAWFDQQPSAVKAKAEERMAILLEVEAARDAGMNRNKAVETVADRHGLSCRAIGDWLALAAQVRRQDWLPQLAPKYKGGGKETGIDATAWRILMTDYLAPERPAFAACYRRLLNDYARPNGITLPSMKTLQRRMERESKALKTLKREGREALRRMVPPQQRTVTGLHAMQAVNVDGHTFDVFVQWEDGTVSRPVMVGIQDVFSRKLLAHRIGETENTLLTRMAFADLFRDYGIPAEAVMDNGRAFASKAVSGGAKTRFRFKIKPNEATGVLTSLGIRIHWTLPYRGSSKPIERGWRDLCEDIAKHPVVRGAYTGNKPDAKPENYRERAIPIAEFREHVARQIAAHNARTDRDTEMARGESFDAVFAASYAMSPIGKASEGQLRLALLEAEDKLCNRRNGSVQLAGNVYWSMDMIELAGEKVTIRFDPDNLHSEIHVYRRNGTYFGAVPVEQKTGFFDKAGSVRRHKLEASVRSKVRAAEEAANLLDRDRLAEIYSGPAEHVPPPVPGASRIVRHRGHTAAALKPSQQAVPETADPDFMANFSAGVRRGLRAVE